MTSLDNSKFFGSCTVEPSPPNTRDFRYEGLLRARSTAIPGKVKEIKLPETLDLRPYLLPVRNQGGRGTCLALSVSVCKEYQEHVDNKVFHDYMSPDSVYVNRVNKDSEGMYGRDAMEILLKLGICREDLLPYDPEAEPRKVPDKAKEEMEHYRIKKYARVDTIEGVKTALLESGPCLICMPVYKNGLAEFWRAPATQPELVGGHAVAIVGYDKKGFILRNSWGKDWNGNGYITFPYSDFGMHWEIWTMVDEETKYIPPHLDPSNPLYEGPCIGCLCHFIRVKRASS
jgi:C1A family cysteine protease